MAGQLKAENVVQVHDANTDKITKVIESKFFERLEEKKQQRVTDEVL
jgi:hypothetical protein